MKHYTIKFNNNNTNTTTFDFRNNNATKALDDLILSNIIKKNPFLAPSYYEKKKSDTIIIDNRITSSPLKGNFDTDFAKAAAFLANYTPTKSIYTFDNNDITFFEDEIQIGSTLIPLYMLESSSYYDLIPKKTKEIIINIFISIKG